MKILLDPKLCHTPTGLGIGVEDAWVWCLSGCCSAAIHFSHNDADVLVWECSACKTIVPAFPQGVASSAVNIKWDRDDNKLQSHAREWIGIPELEVEVSGYPD